MDLCNVKKITWIVNSLKNWCKIMHIVGSNNMLTKEDAERNLKLINDTEEAVNGANLLCKDRKLFNDSLKREKEKLKMCIERFNKN